MWREVYDSAILWKILNLLSLNLKFHIYSVRETTWFQQSICILVLRNGMLKKLVSTKQIGYQLKGKKLLYPQQHFPTSASSPSSTIWYSLSAGRWLISEPSFYKVYKVIIILSASGLMSYSWNWWIWKTVRNLQVNSQIQLFF